MEVDLDVLLRDHELHVDRRDRWQHSAIEELLCGEANTDLEFETLEVDIGMTLRLHETLFQLEVAAVEGS